MTDSEVVPVDPEDREDRRLARELALPEPDTRPTLAIFREVAELSEAIARTNFVPKQYRGTGAECTACILAGHELGLQPMAALNGIDMIEGRSAISGRLMRALILAAGHTIYFEEASTTRVTIVGQRRGSPHVSRVTWTADDVERAGLHLKDVHKKYPRAMLKARATGELARDMFADVITGIAYTPEEVRDGWTDYDEAPPPDEPDGTEPTKVTAEGAAAKTTGKPRKRAAAKTSAQPKTDEPSPPPTVPLPGEDDVVDMVEGADGVHAPAGTEPPTQQPEDPATAAERDQDPDDKPAMTKAQRIAMKAGELELDRGEVIYAVTDGRKTSGRELEDAEADMVLEALRRLKVGELRLEEDDDGSPVLVEAPETPNEEAVETEPDADPDATGAEVDWTQEQWIAYLRPRKVKMVPVLKEAKRLAAKLIEDGATDLKVPDNLGAVRGHPSLASMTRAYVEEQAGDA